MQIKEIDYMEELQLNFRELTKNFGTLILKKEDYFLNIAENIKIEVTNIINNFGLKHCLENIEVGSYGMDIDMDMDFVDYVSANKIHFKAEYPLTYTKNGESLGTWLQIYFTATSDEELNEYTIWGSVVTPTALRIAI